MIIGFENYTYDLTHQEEGCLDSVIDCLEFGDWISNREIARYVRRHVDIELPGPRIRMIIHHLRICVNFPDKKIIAGSRGYLLTSDQKLIETYVQSLNERISSIESVRNSMK